LTEDIRPNANILQLHLHASGAVLSTLKAPFLLASLLIHGLLLVVVGGLNLHSEPTRQTTAVSGNVNVKVIAAAATADSKTRSTVKTSAAGAEVPTGKTHESAQTDQKSSANMLESKSVAEAAAATQQIHTGSGVSGDSVDNEIASYSDELRQFIMKHRNYPTIARKLQHEGIVEVEFVVFADGTIGPARLKQSSGYATIDEAALKLLASLKSFRPLPGELVSRTFVVPINYRLR